MRKSSWFMVAVLLADCGNAGAATTYGVAGPVLTDSIAGVLAGDAAVMTITFNPVPADDDPSPVIGFYSNASGFGVLSIDRGTTLAPYTTNCLNAAIEVENASMDTLTIVAFNCIDSNGLLVDRIGAILEDSSGTAFASDALPRSIDVDDFDSTGLLQTGGQSGAFTGDMRADVRAALVTPEPTVGCGLVALLALAVSAQFKVQRQADANAARARRGIRRDRPNRALGSCPRPISE